MNVLAVRYGDLWRLVWNYDIEEAHDDLAKEVITGVLFDHVGEGPSYHYRKGWRQTLKLDDGTYEHGRVSDFAQPFLTFRPSADLPFPI